MEYKRITLLCGHYGSGKTNIAVNMAFDLKKKCDNVTIADLDIVNPYFRTKDSAKQLEEARIRLVCSEYAGSNVDIPALPQDIYALTDDKASKVIIDVGGDDRGALALGRIAPQILAENDYEMILVINKFRPLTPDAESTKEVLEEIENACKMKFTGIINNSNLGEETTVDDVLSSEAYARSVSGATGLPILATTVSEKIYNSLEQKEKFFCLELQDKIN